MDAPNDITNAVRAKVAILAASQHRGEKMTCSPWGQNTDIDFADEDTNVVFRK
jgi:hypothetical protein